MQNSFAHAWNQLGSSSGMFSGIAGLLRTVVLPTFACVATLCGAQSFFPDTSVAQDFYRNRRTGRYQDSDAASRGRDSSGGRLLDGSAVGDQVSRRSFMELFNPNPTQFDLFYTYAPSREPDSSGGSEFDNSIFRSELNIPLATSQNLAWNLGGTYVAREYDLGSSRRGSLLADDKLYLHQAEVRPGIFYFINKDLLVAGQVRAGLWGNLGDDVSEDNFQLLGNAMLIYRWRPRVQLIGGLAVTEDFDEEKILPILGFRYLSESKRWHWLVTLPTQAQLQYNFSKTFHAYGGLTISGGQFHYEPQSGRSSESGRSFDIQVRDTKLGGGLLFDIGEHLLLGVEGGMLIGKEAFTVKALGSEYDSDLKDSPYIQGRLSARF